MKKVLISILVLVFFIGCSDTVNENAGTKKDNSFLTGNKSNKIILKDTAGSLIKVKKIEEGYIFEGFENKIVILNFFATWCPPCKAEIPHLNALQKKYKNDVKIISVLLEENKPNLEIMEFINKYEIEFTITNSIGNNKLENEVGGVEQIPFMIIYDRKGKYSQHYVGAVPEEMIDIDIQKVL